MPHWSPDTAITHVTYNACSETAAYKPTFRQAWNRAHHCIIPAEAIFEADHSGHKPVPTRISLRNGEPMGIAGLWACSESAVGDVYSFTMLTVNAEENTLMRQFGMRGAEKRMVVILPPERYQDWLDAPADASQDFMRTYPSQALQAQSTALQALPRVPWDDAMESGIRGMDLQHRELFSMIDDLIDMHEAGQSTQAMDTVLPQLANYALFHFNEEEMLMCRVNNASDFIRLHMAQHKGFLDAMDRIKKLRNTHSDAHAAREMARFLQTWLVDHIVNTDSKLTRLCLAQGIVG